MQEEHDMSPTQLEFPQQIAPLTASMSINAILGLRNSGTLVLRPPFQRNLVWTPDQQALLIDTILRGLPVPEVYVQTKVTADGAEETVVVDGQQRISAFLRFISDELRLQRLPDLDPRWDGKVFSELEDALRQRFRTFELVVRKLPDLGDDALREIFRRLNKTVEPLEPQELRHAAYVGEFITLVEDLAAAPIIAVVGAFSAKDYLRRRSDEFFAEVSYAVGSRAFPNKKEGLDDLFLTFETQGTPVEYAQELERRFGRVFALLSDIAGVLRRTRFRNKSDFYSLLVLLANNAEKLPTANPQPLLDALTEFSLLVNEIKREEAAERSVDTLVAGPHGSEALRYLRAVERAASDRLNRVRRGEALSAIVSPHLDRARTPLGAPDSAWREDLHAMSDDEMDLGPTAEDLDTTERALSFPRADLDERI